MRIFNSLGSNYTLGDALRVLTTRNSPTHSERLMKYLGDKYQGKVVLLYKGREAVELALKLIGAEESAVVVNGYTCFVVYKAIKNAKWKPVLVDVPERQLDFTVDQLQGVLAKHPEIKVVMIQNTLGYPVNVQPITELCQQKKLILIEDLAHSVGATYANGQEAGTVGDFVILSFSQDKMIDGVAGGAVIIRNAAFQPGTLPPLQSPQKSQQRRDRWYPLLTWLVRATHGIGLGKVLLFLLKRFSLLSQPLGTQPAADFHELPHWYSRLTYQQFLRLKENLEHRRSIAKIYQTSLPRSVLPPQLVDLESHSTHLRFPVLVDKRIELISFLKQHNIYVSDIWYDAPVAPKKYMAAVTEQLTLPQAQLISEQMVNLPTHRHISVSDAQRIVSFIQTWLTSK